MITQSVPVSLPPAQMHAQQPVPVSQQPLPVSGAHPAPCDLFDDGVDYRKDGVWKVLKDIPKLEKRALQLSVWKAELMAIAHAVGRRWFLFLQERFQQAEFVYEQRQIGKLSTYLVVRFWLGNL